MSKPNILAIVQREYTTYLLVDKITHFTVDHVGENHVTVGIYLNGETVQYFYLDKYYYKLVDMLKELLPDNLVERVVIGEDVEK
jgi:hypothetical protein